MMKCPNPRQDDVGKGKGQGKRTMLLLQIINGQTNDEHEQSDHIAPEQGKNYQIE